jgi:hypothetical protein
LESEAVITRRRVGALFAVVLASFGGCGTSTPTADFIDDVDELCEEAAFDADADGDDVADGVTTLLDGIDALGTPSGLDDDEIDAFEDFVGDLDDALDDFDRSDDDEKRSFWVSGDGAEALGSAQTAADSFGARSCERFADEVLPVDDAEPDDTDPVDTDPSDDESGDDDSGDAGEATSVTVSLPDSTVAPRVDPSEASPPATIAPAASYSFQTGIPELPLPAGYSFFPYDELDDRNVDLLLEGTTLADQLVALYSGAVMTEVDGSEVARVWYAQAAGAALPDEWLRAMCQDQASEMSTPAGYPGVGCTLNGVDGTTDLFVTLVEDQGITVRWTGGPAFTAASFYDAILAGLS